MPPPKFPKKQRNLLLPFPSPSYLFMPNSKKPFGNVVLVTLFVFFENTSGWKKCVEIRVMLFKNWKHVFKHMYQMASRSQKPSLNHYKTHHQQKTQPRKPTQQKIPATITQPLQNPPNKKSRPPSENLDPEKLQPTLSNKIRKKSVPPRDTVASLWRHHHQRHCHTRIADLSTPWHEVWRCTQDPFQSTHKYRSVMLFMPAKVVTNETHDHSNKPSKSLKTALWCLNSTSSFCNLGLYFHFSVFFSSRLIVLKKRINSRKDPGRVKWGAHIESNFLS